MELFAASQRRMSEESCDAFPPVAIALAAVAAVLALLWCAFIVNGRFGFVPLLFVRIINDRSFLAEYDRRTDKVVEHDLRKRYRFGRKLGEGVTSSVYRIQEKATGTYFALKRIPLKKSQSIQRAVEREIKILKRLRHHHVTVLHDVYSSPSKIWAVLEFVSGGELTHYIQQSDAQWDETHAARTTFQVLSALAYLHSQGVCHRDIKLANLLRSSRGQNFQMKVADFGAACLMEVPDDCAVAAAAGSGTSPSLQRFKEIRVGKECIGTPCNMAPEVFDRRYGPMCDMWSFGCVLYEILLGEPPFDPYKLPPDDPERHLKANVRAAKYPTKELSGWADLSGEAIQLLTALLTASPLKRLSAWEALQSPWMKVRHRDPASAPSNLTNMRNHMIERRKTISKSHAQLPMPSGGAVAGGAVAGGAAPSAKPPNSVEFEVASASAAAATPPPPPPPEGTTTAEAPLPAMMVPRREPSAMFEAPDAEQLAGAEEDDPLPKEERKTAVTDFYQGESGLEDESSTFASAGRQTDDEQADAGQVQVEVRPG